MCSKILCCLCVYYNAHRQSCQPMPLLLGGFLFGFLCSDLAAVGFAGTVDQSRLSERDSSAGAAM